MLVRELGEKLCLWAQIEAAARLRCDSGRVSWLLEQVGRIPVQHSRATSRLGSYVFRGREPVCIRLQFAQEADSLRQTFLHEIAHACDHLMDKGNQQQRVRHDRSWQLWAQALGISPAVRGQSAVLSSLHKRRKKLVAVCQVCGVRIYRVRQLNRKGIYIHPACGGTLQAIRS